jgi:hypothetical protein
MTPADVERRTQLYQRLKAAYGSQGKPYRRSEILVDRAETKSMLSTVEGEEKRG